jgi:hypothetical protein
LKREIWENETVENVRKIRIRKNFLRNEISFNNTGLPDEFVGWGAGDIGAR